LRQSSRTVGAVSARSAVSTPTASIIDPQAPEKPFDELALLLEAQLSSFHRGQRCVLMVGRAQHSSSSSGSCFFGLRLTDVFSQGRQAAAPAAFHAAKRFYAADAKASPTEVSSLLEQRIRGVQEEASLAETGRVLSVGYVASTRSTIHRKRTRYTEYGAWK
jgi:hypothetical protein